MRIHHIVAALALLSAPAWGQSLSPATGLAPTPTSQPNITSNQTLASGTVGNAITLTNAGAGTFSVTLSGLTASGATVAFSASDNGGASYYTVGAVSGAANTRTTTATADGSYSFSVAGRSSIQIAVSVAGTGTITAGYTASAAVRIVTVDTSAGSPLFTQPSGGALGSLTDAAAAPGAASASVVALGKEWNVLLASVIGAGGTAGAAGTSSLLAGCTMTGGAVTSGQQVSLRCDQYGELVTTAAVEYYGGGVVGSNGSASSNATGGGALNIADMNCTSGGTCTPTNSTTPKPVAQTGALPAGTNTIGAVSLKATAAAPTGGNYTVTTSAATAIAASTTRQRLTYQLQGTGYACGSTVTASVTIAVSSANVVTCGGSGAFVLTTGQPPQSSVFPFVSSGAMTVIGAAGSGTLALNLAYEQQ